MDVFGKPQNLELEVYSSPGDYQSELVDPLHRVADSAFDREGVPEKSDTRDHVVPSEVLIAAKADGDYVGFSSASDVKGTIYEVGIAVEEEMQGEGLGGLLLTKGVEEMADGEETFTYRTQNPEMYGVANKFFDVYPSREEKTPEETMKAVEEVAEALEPKNQRGHVQNEAYGEGGMYETLPDGETMQLLEEIGMDPGEGDAVIVAAELDEGEAEEAYHRAREEFADVSLEVTRK